MSKEQILIVGGAGYIGGYVTDLLIKQGHDVVVYDNLLFEDRYLKPLPHFIHGDIRDYDRLLKVIHYYKPTTIVWLAAIVGDGACQVDVSLTKTLNEDCVKWLVDQKLNSRIIFTSTCSVYGLNNNKDITENATPNPLSAYAYTKLAAEQYVLAHSPNALAFRLGTLYGVGDTYSRLRFDLVANVLTLKACLNEDITVFGGEQWRPLLHVRDVATAIAWGIDNNISGLYNLTDKNYTIAMLAQAIQEETKEFSKSKVTLTDMKFEDLRNYHVSNEKLIHAGYSPRYTLQHGINQLVDLLRSNRIRLPKDAIYSNEAYMKRLANVKG